MMTYRSVSLSGTSAFEGQESRGKEQRENLRCKVARRSSLTLSSNIDGSGKMAEYFT